MSESHFLFDGQYHDQIDGVSMGSPLARVLANLFIGYHERNWIHDYTGPMVYRCFVDDTFCIFINETEALKFLKYLNSRHRDMKYV